MHQLRAPVADFVGREREITNLVAALSSDAAATISGMAGMGGIGKTELAMVVSDALIERCSGRRERAHRLRCAAGDTADAVQLGEHREDLGG